MRAVVFINYSIAPFNAGHVGWGFETEPGYFCYGAKEAVGMQEEDCLAGIRERRFRRRRHRAGNAGRHENREPPRKRLHL